MFSYIYVLKCPIKKDIRYVGQSIDVQRRYNLHLYHSKNGRAKTHKEKWINSLLLNNLLPELEIIDCCDVSLIDEKEIYYIEKFKKNGCQLTNSTLGGKTTSGRPCSEETKQKFREMFKGKNLRPPIKEKEKIDARNRMLGFKHSEKTKQKLSDARKGKASFWTTNEMPKEYKDRLSNYGKMCSKKVLCITNGKIYNSTVEAEKDTLCDRKSIRGVCNGVYKQIKGYKFKFYEN